MAMKVMTESIIKVMTSATARSREPSEMRRPVGAREIRKKSEARNPKSESPLTAPGVQLRK
jgi:hypothetical protein